MMTTPKTTRSTYAPSSMRAAENDRGAHDSLAKKKDRAPNNCKGDFAALLIASQIFQTPARPTQAGACAPAESVQSVSAGDPAAASVQTASGDSASASGIADKGLVVTELSTGGEATTQPTGTPITPAKISAATLIAQAPARGRLELSSPSFAPQGRTTGSTLPTPNSETFKAEGRTVREGNIAAQEADTNESQRFGEGQQSKDFGEVEVVQSGDAGAHNKEAARRDSAFLASALAEAARRTRAPIAPPKLTTDGHGESNSQGEPAYGTSTPESNVAAPQLNKQPAGVAVSSSISTTRAGFDAWAEVRAATVQILSPTLALAHATRTQEARSVRLRLHPEELGEVEVHISRGAQGRLSAHIIAENEQARHALSEGLAQLRADLERAGLALESLDVRAQSGREQAGGSGSQSHDAPDARTSFETVNAQSNASGARAAGDDKLLSVRA